MIERRKSRLTIREDNEKIREDRHKPYSPDPNSFIRAAAEKPKKPHRATGILASITSVNSSEDEASPTVAKKYTSGVQSRLTAKGARRGSRQLSKQRSFDDAIGINSLIYKVVTR